MNSAQEQTVFTDGVKLFICAMIGAYLLVFIGTEIALWIKSEAFFLLSGWDILRDVVWINAACKTTLLLSWKLFYMVILPVGVVAGITMTVRNR